MLWLYIGVAVIVVLALLFLASRIFASGAEGPDGAPTPVAAATAAPLAAGTPAPEPDGTLVFTDSFDSDLAKSGLEDEIDAEDFQRGVHPPGVYHLLSDESGTHWSILPRLAYRDFSLQLMLQDNSDSFDGSAAQGVIVRVRDDDHFYMVLLDSRGGRYAVRKQDGEDNSTDLIGWTPSPAIKGRDGQNLLRVDAKDETFTIYLNGALLDSFSDGDYGFGMVGMVIEQGDAEQPHLHVDDIQIWSSDTTLLSTLLEEKEDPAGDMVLIPGGEFIIGSNERSGERPHIYGLPDFYIDRTEVTNAAYAACVGAGVCTAQSSSESETHGNYAADAQYADFPAIYVSWQQAQAFCDWAGKRLPTEAEWEKAASWNATTGEKSVWPWGNQFNSELLNSNETDRGDTTHVSDFAREINGTVDMGGNVSEWTSSLYTDYPYSEGDGREDAEDSGDRVFRGGSWAQTEGKARTFFRQGAEPDYADREIGFRCALTP